MAASTFGRRGQRVNAQTESTSAISPIAMRDPRLLVAMIEPNVPERTILDDIPFLTIGVMFFLMIVFGLEKRFAYDFGKGATLSLQSLIAFGAVSYDLSVGSGEYWRVLLAPLLHASYSHVIGNVIALFFAGVRLEPLIGRAWVAAIFTLSAFGGVVGSVMCNDPDIPSVGASGAITGLVGALFVVSFSPKADPAEQRSMRKVSLFFGVPALAPLLWGASDSTDYFCHLGGAVVGIIVAIALCLKQQGANEARPGVRPAGIGSLMSAVASLAAVFFVVSGYAAHAQKAAFLIPVDQMPVKMTVDERYSEWLVEVYPRDPRSHLVRGVFFAGKNKQTSAEEAFRMAVAVAKSEGGARMVAKLAQTGLALVVAEQGRISEAKALAGDLCRPGAGSSRRKLLEKAKLCD